MRDVFILLLPIAAQVILIWNLIHRVDISKRKSVTPSILWFFLISAVSFGFLVSMGMREFLISLFILFNMYSTLVVWRIVDFLLGLAKPDR